MILSAIQERRSVREYAAKEVPREIIAEIIRAAQYAPTAMNNRAVEYVVVRAPGMKGRLLEILEPRQTFLLQAPVVIIPVVDNRKSVAATADLSIASSFIMLQAAALGLGSVWKHIAPGKDSELRNCLGLPPDYAVLNVIPVGHPAKKMPPHSEKEYVADKLHLEKW